MKKYIVLLFWGITLTLNAQFIMLPVPLVKQKKDNWCGAAAAECVLKYNKIDIGQCAIMDYVRGIEPQTYGDQYFCCDYAPSFPHPCDKGMALGYDYETVSVHNVLMHYATNGNLFSYAAKGIIPESDIMIQVSSNFGQPMLAQWDMYDGLRSTHLVVICGTENGEIQFMNPDIGKIKSLSYAQFKKDKDHKWEDGYLLLTSPYPAHCYNCKQDTLLGETGIDCGGPSCPPCHAPPPPPPPSCTNCNWDQNEAGIDCGGPCSSPCEDVPEERILDANTIIRSEVMAFKKITTSGNVRITSGKTVSFITEEEGSIFLLPGFKAEQGCTFTTQRKDLSGCSRTCEHICYKAWLPSFCNRTGYKSGLHIYDLHNAVKIEYEIYDMADQLKYSNAINVLHNGTVFLWNCILGVGFAIDKVQYKIYYSVYYCNGDKKNYAHIFTVQGGSKSLTEEPEEPETSPQFSPPHPDNTPLHSSTVPPKFSIIPNPNHGTFQLETNFPFSDIAHLKITTPLGVSVYETKNLASNTIQLYHSASGMFFVVMVLKNGNVLTQKMMVR
jgi:hypothetical protein